MDNTALTMLTQERDLSYIGRLVLKTLLKNASDSKAKRPRLSQRSIAGMIGTDTATVAMSLRSLEDEGIIRREHLRIIIGRDSLQKIAGEKERI